jgi:DNA invertase Pin-like site-specific DNA recombinase
MSEKIQPTHLERAAYVYVRQSSLHQVRHHRESQRRQYALAARARTLGFREVQVLDEDLGRSGSGSQDRPGFAKLLAVVCAGGAGAVLALEASRLARNNRDWHHLIDLCALTDTLVIDHDGVYDPARLNDRLVLGLKGTMSEFELSLMRQRAQEALLQKIQRGEVLWRVPIGYRRTEDNRIEITPDRQIQDAVAGVFRKFAELGSARQVLLWYRQHDVPLPTLSVESGCREVVWRLPVYGRVLSILKNPVYAGAFVFGRRRTKTVVVDGRARKTDGHDVPRDQWSVVIRDHHPGYISWETYLRNQEQIESNANMRGKMASGQRGAAKAGPALLAGLLRCGQCGRKLHVGYSGTHGKVPRYFCRGAHLNHGTDWCISVGGLRVDRAVVATVLEALEPLHVEASLDAWDRLQAGEDQKRRSFQLALEKARYEADRIRRQYEAVDPENRLVAAELETRWNQVLRRVEELEARLNLAEQDERPLAENERRRLLVLGEDLNEVWNHPAASATLKKRILRTVLKEVVVDEKRNPARVILRLHWSGGVHTELAFSRNPTGKHRRCTDRQVVDLVRDLAKVCDDVAITAILNRLGYRTGAGNTWTEPRVRALRQYQEIPTLDRSADHPWMTLEQAARHFGVSAGFVRRLVIRGTLPGRQVVRYAPWVIERRDLELPAVQAAVQAVRDGHRGPLHGDGTSGMPLFTACSEV